MMELLRSPSSCIEYYDESSVSHFVHIDRMMIWNAPAKFKYWLWLSIPYIMEKSICGQVLVLILTSGDIVELGFLSM